MSDSEIFDRQVRRARRNRAAQLPAQARVLHYVCDDLLDRLTSVKRSFETALIINAAPTGLAAALRAQAMTVTCADPGDIYAAESNGVCCDEDRLPLSSERFDLILSVGLLDSLHDVPGALVLMRRALKPGGMLLCAFAGAGSLDHLRNVLRTVEPNQLRTHPQIDVRAGGDLLTRTGFVLPVADVDTLKLRYDSLDALLAELRANAATNVLTERKPMTRAVYTALRTAYTTQAPFSETLAIVTLTGWAPSQ